MVESLTETRDDQERGALVSAGRGLERKAVALLSGGLDSTLAVKLMLEQGIDVLAVNFVSPFCTCSPRREGGCHMASEVARQLGVAIRVLNKGMEYLKLVESPRFGHGRGLNPCIDCRIFMLRKVAGILAEHDASFVVTGDVLGQRPMSQHIEALDLIDRESGLRGRILRPLSAHLLEPTIPERTGIVVRQRLLSVRGRSRRTQLSLARERGIDFFSCAAGGCLLTDPVITRRLKDLFLFCPGYEMRDARLVTFGRHFRLREKLKVIMGRNESENSALIRIAGHYPRMELADFPGPLMLLCGDLRAGDSEKLGRLLRFYTKKVTDEEVAVRWSLSDRSESFWIREMAAECEVECWRI